MMKCKKMKQILFFCLLCFNLMLIISGCSLKDPRNELIEAFPDYESIINENLSDEYIKEFIRKHKINSELSFSDLCESVVTSDKGTPANIIESVDYLKKTMGEDKNFNYSLRDCFCGVDNNDGIAIFGFNVYIDNKESDINITYITNLESKEFQSAIVSKDTYEEDVLTDFFTLSLLTMTSFEPEFKNNTDLAFEILYEAANGYRKYNDYLFMFNDKTTFSIQPKEITKTWFE